MICHRVGDGGGWSMILGWNVRLKRLASYLLNEPTKLNLLPDMKANALTQYYLDISEKDKSELQTTTEHTQTTTPLLQLLISLKTSCWLVMWTANVAMECCLHSACWMWCDNIGCSGVNWSYSFSFINSFIVFCVPARCHAFARVTLFPYQVSIVLLLITLIRREGQNSYLCEHYWNCISVSQITWRHLISSHLIRFICHPFWSAVFAGSLQASHLKCLGCFLHLTCDFGVVYSIDSSCFWKSFPSPRHCWIMNYPPTAVSILSNSSTGHTTCLPHPFARLVQS